MQAYLLTGKGHFTDNEGKEVVYPICKLVLQNDDGDSIEVKLDKTAKLLIPYVFQLQESGQLTEDSAGNEVEIVYLKEKNSSAHKKIMVE